MFDLFRITSNPKPLIHIGWTCSRLFRCLFTYVYINCIPCSQRPRHGQDLAGKMTNQKCNIFQYSRVQALGYRVCRDVPSSTQVQSPPLSARYNVFIPKSVHQLSRLGKAIVHPCVSLMLLVKSKTFIILHKKYPKEMRVKSSSLSLKY